MFIINPYRYAGGAAFDPTALTGYQFHLIANSLDGTYTDGEVLNATDGFPDETGNYDYKAVSGSPTFETNEVNGNDIVRFVGADFDRLRDLTNDFPATNKFTQVWVMKTPSTATQLFLHRMEFSAQGYFLKRNNDDLNFFANNTSLSLGTGDFTPSPAAGNWWIIIWTVDFPSGSSYVYINDVTAQGSATGSGDSTNQNAQYWHIPADTGHPDMDLAEVILYSGYVLTSQEISDMLTYMGTKYNITVTT